MLSSGFALSQSEYSAGLQLGTGFASDNYKDPLTLGGYIESEALDFATLRGTVSYAFGDTEQDILSKGDFDMLSFELSMIKRLEKEGAAPFLGAGVGYYIPNTDIDQRLDNALSSVGLRVDEDLDSAIGFHLLAGFDVPLSEDSSIEFMGKYIVAETEVDAEVNGGLAAIFDVDLNALFVTVGIRKQF